MGKMIYPKRRFYYPRVVKGYFILSFCASSAGLMPGCWHLFYFLFQFIELLCRAVRKLYYNLSEYR